MAHSDAVITFLGTGIYIKFYLRNGAVYKGLNLERASRDVHDDRSCGTRTHSPCYALLVIESSWQSLGHDTLGPTLLNIECYCNTFRGARLHVPVQHPKGC